MFASTHMNVGARNAFAANDLTAKFRKMTTAAATPRTTASKALVIESTSRARAADARVARVARRVGVFARGVGGSGVGGVDARDGDGDDADCIACRSFGVGAVVRGTTARCARGWATTTRWGGARGLTMGDFRAQICTV